MADPAPAAVRLDADASSPHARLARNRATQRELYGAPLAERVHRLTAALGVSQARLARALGMSPPMLSQLVSGRRVKIGDPAVLARLMLLDRVLARTPAHHGPMPAGRVAALLADVAAARLQWAATDARASGHRPDPAGQGAVAALRSLAPPARLAAAAATLASGFPELAHALRQAASRTGRGPSGRGW